jgi:hypothetical protein
MGELTRDAVDHFKEVAWAVFLLYLVLAALTVLFGRHLGYDTMAYISLGFAVLITLVFAIIFAINLIYAVVVRSLRNRRRKDVS